MPRPPCLADVLDDRGHLELALILHLAWPRFADDARRELVDAARALAAHRAASASATASETSSKETQ